MYSIKNVYPAHSVKEALLMYELHPDALYIAGGSDLLVAVRDGKIEDAELISLHDIEELKGISAEPGGTLVIGPMTCFTDLNESEILRGTAYILGEAAGEVGGPQIRNTGTVGGNICNGVTSADTASTLMAYDAVLELTGPEGVRMLPIREFYIGARKVALRPGEILTAIRIPREAYEGYYGQYIKFSTRRAMDIATIGCSVNLKLSAEGDRLEDIRIAFGVAGPVPARMPAAEEAFRGAQVTDDLPERIGRAVLSEIRPRDSWRASAEFRTALAEELTARAVRRGLAQAGGLHE